jgi:hypothetical protein
MDLATARAKISLKSKSLMVAQGVQSFSLAGRLGQGVNRKTASKKRKREKQGSQEDVT